MLMTMEDVLRELHDNPEPYASNPFIHDVMAKYRRYGTVTDRQLTAVLAAMVKATAPKALAPTGRQTVTGRIIKVGPYTGKYGTSNKMTVQLENGSRVWATVPAGAVAEVGNTITFTATFTPSDKDPSFAFGTRPTLAPAVPEPTLGDLAAQFTQFTDLAPFAAGLADLASPPKAKPERSVLEQLLDEVGV